MVGSQDVYGFPLHIPVRNVTKFYILYIISVLADIISCVEFNSTGELLATGDKGGRIVIFQQEQGVSLDIS